MSLLSLSPGSYNFILHEEIQGRKTHCREFEKNTLTIDLNSDLYESMSFKLGVADMAK